MEQETAPLAYDSSAQERRHLDFARDRIDADSLVKWLLGVWAVASAVTGVLLLYLRIGSGPVDSFWRDLAMAIWFGPPMLLIAIYFIGGWILFVLRAAFWLLTRPFRSARGSRFMRFIHRSPLVAELRSRTRT